MKERRGTALPLVLIVCATAGLLCASLMRARLQATLTAAGTTRRIQDGLAEQAALNRVQQAWMASGSCTSNAAAGISCRGSGCRCACTVTGLAQVTSVPRAGACVLTVQPLP